MQILNALIAFIFIFLGQPNSDGLCDPIRLFQLMANDKANWEPPLRRTAEPVLKVYSTFTRTKVRPFQPLSPLNSLFRSSE
jgi:hypothetical protein